MKTANTIRRTPKHPESHLQKVCVKWFRLQYKNLSGVFFAVPNGGKRNALEGAIMKGEGVLSGVSDLVLLVANRRYNGLCIEMKTPKGTQSDTQKIFMRNVEEQGYKYAICRSFTDFQNTINEYLSE